MQKFWYNFKKFLGNKKVKYGSYATLLTAAFLAILVVINLIVQTVLPFEKDLTKNKLFSFSDQTIDVLNSLEQPVNIFALYSQGNQDEFIMEVLNRYAKKSKFINIEIVDPVKNPGFVKKYDTEGKGISNGSFIFESGDKVKVVSTLDLLNINYQTQSVDSIAAEQRFTSAIMYVTSVKVPTLYLVQGHGETEMSSIKNELEKENLDVKPINILTEDIPENADIILINSPKKDFNTSEVDKLDAYLEKGGRGIFLFDIAKDELPKLEMYLEEWGVKLNRDVIVEGKQNKFFQVPTYILPEIQSHEITGKIKSNNMIMLVPQARSLDIVFEEKGYTKVTPLLKSSVESWGKVNLDSKTIEKEAGDVAGPLNLAVAVSRENYDEKDNYKKLKETRLIVMGNAAFMDSSILSMPGHANTDFFLNSANWMLDEGSKITIRAKSLRPERLEITSYAQILLYSALVIIVLPLIVFVAGGVVWSRRRHL